MKITCPASLLLLALLVVCGCTSQGLVDSLVYGAHRPAIVPWAEAQQTAPPGRGRFVTLAGDMHCHVSPPDSPDHVDRGLEETLTLARTEGLDFVVLTPHLGARFFMHPEQRKAAAESQRWLREELARLPAGDIELIAGFEYTDHRFGHVGVSFADLDAVLADVPIEEAQLHPERFFERWVARGGVLVVNHPFVTPLSSIVPIARADLSWRPFTGHGPFPPEIEAIDRLAQGFEAFNLSGAELRDRLLVGDREHTLRETLARLDSEIPRQHRRMAPVGGSDSHGHHLRATTFLLSRGRTRPDIREAIGLGRTCVRDPAACSFEVRAENTAPWSVVGASLAAAPAVEVRAHVDVDDGRSIDVYVNGERVASPASDEVVRVALPGGACSVVRARVEQGYSAPVYVGCGL